MTKEEYYQVKQKTMEKAECFLCSKDITHSTKVISYFCFPDKIWVEAEKNWAKDFRKLFNGCLCSKCAEKDLQTARETDQRIHKEEIKKLEEAVLNSTRPYKKLFGRIYIKL